MIEKIFEVTNKSGLHARPASMFVKEAKKYKANIKLICKDCVIDGKSILSIMSSCIMAGSSVSIKIDGEDEVMALNGIEALFANNFGE